MSDFGPRRMYIRSAEGAWLPLGEVKASMITIGDGPTIYSGQPEDVFDLRQTPEDRALLAAMNISSPRD